MKEYAEGDDSWKHKINAEPKEGSTELVEEEEAFVTPTEEQTVPSIPAGGASGGTQEYDKKTTEVVIPSIPAPEPAQELEPAVVIPTVPSGAGEAAEEAEEAPAEQK